VLKERVNLVLKNTYTEMGFSRAENLFTPTVEDIDFSKYRTPWISYFLLEKTLYPWISAPL